MSYQRQGKLAEAEPFLVQALEVRRRVLGAEHPDTLHSLYGVALLYRKQGKRSEAEGLLVQALEGRLRRAGGADPQRWKQWTNLRGSTGIRAS